MRCTAILFLLVCGCAQREVSSSNAPLDPALADLSFMLGDYSCEKNGVTTSEHWIAPGGKVMLGLGSTVKNGETLFFEYLRIEAQKDGIYYIAQPRGSPPTAFKLVKSTRASAVFQNLLHDFPNSILYERMNPRTIRARIEGTLKGEPAFEEWIYHRTG